MPHKKAAPHAVRGGAQVELHRLTIHKGNTTLSSSRAALASDRGNALDNTSRRLEVKRGPMRGRYNLGSKDSRNHGGG